MWLDAVSFLERAICCRSYYAQSCSGIILLTVRNHWCEQPTYKIAENVAYIDNPKIINLQKEIEEEYVIIHLLCVPR